MWLYANGGAHGGSKTGTLAGISQTYTCTPPILSLLKYIVVGLMFSHYSHSIKLTFCHREMKVVIASPLTVFAKHLKQYPAHGKLKKKKSINFSGGFVFLSL